MFLFSGPTQFFCHIYHAQQVKIISLPGLRATSEIMTHNCASPCLQSTALSDYTIVQILHHFTMTVNNIEVTVNTSTCTDVFTIMTN